VHTAHAPSQIAGILAVAILIAVLVFAAGLFAGRGLIQDMFFILTMLVLAQFWNLLAGYGGLVSIGQQAFVGMGAYAMFGGVILAGLDPIPAILLGGVAALIVAVPTAFFAFRLQGPYFAIGTWVIAEVVRLSWRRCRPSAAAPARLCPVRRPARCGRRNGSRQIFDVRNSAARDILSYWLASSLAAGTIAASTALLRSKRGLALSAVRDNPEAAKSVGVDAAA
jgi:branched-chain amino acid transport system permease protein